LFAFLFDNTIFACYAIQIELFRRNQFAKSSIKIEVVLAQFNSFFPLLLFIFV